ncbi:MAG: hypothetical protein GAK35_02006 [Herbaspirillum frisingense]|uniref:N-acetyltransferase domain-containing protein n=1 Tax=Herbaspirillum frisingense TaxID=92645 RepID=A0A7V8JUK6_9BURK|nr:MAG: hypothetical protein GAK35_02006 [Herbaspirillum frisingense]
MLAAFIRSTAADAQALAAIRVTAMRASLEKAGRFDAERARMRFLSAFDPACCFFIKIGEHAAGLFTLRREADAFILQHLYLLPEYHGRELDSQVLRRLLAHADRERLPMRLAALRGSDANHFYQRHGFLRTSEEAWDIHYERPVPVREHHTAQASSPAHTPRIRPLIPDDLAALEGMLRQHMRDLHSGEVVEDEVRAICTCMSGALDGEGHLRSYLVAADERDEPLACTAIAEPQARMRKRPAPNCSSSTADRDIGMAGASTTAASTGNTACCPITMARAATPRAGARRLPEEMPPSCPTQLLSTVTSCRETPACWPACRPGS